MRSAIAFALLVSTAACGPSSVSERRSLEELRPRHQRGDSLVTMQLELAVEGHDSGAVRTLLIDHRTAYRVPAAELRYLRMEREDVAEAGWPEGWQSIAGTQAYGTHTDGMHIRRWYRDRLHLVRTADDAPRELTVRMWYPNRATAPWPRVTESGWVTVRFDGVAHPLVEADLGEPDPYLFTVSRYSAGETKKTFAIRFDGTWESSSAHGALDAPSYDGFRGFLRSAAVWTLLDGDDAELSADPDVPPVFRVAVVHGDGFAQRTIEGYDFLDDPGWTAIREEIERLTGEDLLR